MVCRRAPLLLNGHVSCPWQPSIGDRWEGRKATPHLVAPVWLAPLTKVSRMRIVTTFRWGQAAPEFELPSAEGGPISRREFRGRDVVLGAFGRGGRSRRCVMSHESARRRRA